MTQKKVKPISLVDQVTEELKASIMGGERKAGDKLPSEAALAEIYGVNRLTVRMALQNLSALGVVETRVGEGSFVREFSFPGYLDGISGFYLKSGKIEEIFALRKLLELECARIACESRTEEELSELRAFLEDYLRLKKMHRSGGDCLEELTEADMRFHDQICRMSRNAAFADVAAFARSMVKGYIARLIGVRNEKWKQSGGDESDTDQHRLVCEAIAAKDFEACRKAYLELIDYRL